MAIQLAIVTPTREAVAMECDEVIAPGAEGEVGLLPGHVPLITALSPGVLTVYKGGHQRFFAVGTGFAEIEARRRPRADVDLRRRRGDRPPKSADRPSRGGNGARGPLAEQHRVRGPASPFPDQSRPTGRARPKHALARGRGGLLDSGSRPTPNRGRPGAIPGRGAHPVREGMHERAESTTGHR